MLNVRLFRPQEADTVAAMVRRTIREVNGPDYGPEENDWLINSYTPEHLLGVATEGHLYVAELDGALAGCGAVLPFRGNPEEAYIAAVFTHADYLGRGVGRAIMEALAGDEIYRRAKRVEFTSSITALAFYEKLGYTHVGGTPILDDGCYHMEKKNT